MTDIETLAALGFVPGPAETSGAGLSEHSSRPDVAGSARGNVEYPSRRSLREAREAAAASVPPVPQAPTEQPRVAAPFGLFDPTSTPVAPAAAGSRRAARATAGRTSTATRRPLRKRLTAAGTMVLVGGLFASVTLPAYASNEVVAPLADVAAAGSAQKVALSSASTALAASTDEARDGYDATSAADLKRLYRDALRQQNLASYLASGAKEMGDDYPWPAELTRGQGGGLSPLNYFYRECVDFVAWRLNRDAGSTKAPFKYTWSTLTPGGGSAISWKHQWEVHGWPISTTPAPGWVAWFPGQNHVAYVSGILEDGSVAIEEYNWGPNIYGQRVIPADSAIYLSPPPR